MRLILYMSKRCTHAGCPGWEFHAGTGLCKKHLQGSRESGAESVIASPKTIAKPLELKLSKPASPPELLIEVPEVKSKIPKEHDGMAAVHHNEQLFMLAAQSVSKDNSRAHAEWSWLLYEGAPGITQDRKKAYNLAQAGHALGCAHCTGSLARCYFEGCEVHSSGDFDDELPPSEAFDDTDLLKDADQALLLARISASTGSSFGQYVEGLCYHQGKGFPNDDPRDKASDYATALALWTLAADQGLADAQFGLAGMYSNGFGIDAPDQEKAFTLFEMAGQQGHKSAQFMAAMFCQRGLGTAVNMHEARRWCELSAAQGVKSAIQFLQSLPE